MNIRVRSSSVVGTDHSCRLQQGQLIEGEMIHRLKVEGACVIEVLYFNLSYSDDILRGFPQRTCPGKRVLWKSVGCASVRGLLRVEDGSESEYYRHTGYAYPNVRSRDLFRPLRHRYCLRRPTRDHVNE
jgi:hypothetical protein